MPANVCSAVRRVSSFRGALLVERRAVVSSSGLRRKYRGRVISEEFMNFKALQFNTLRAMLAVVVTCVVLLGARPLRAQVDAGTILGTVKDISGASVNGASV